MASRLNRDLSSAPRPLRIELREVDDGDFEWFLEDTDGLGASMSTQILEDDDMSDLLLEREVAGLADALAGTLWPDDLTTPWPACPTGRDHPLMPSVVRGKATWRCERGHGVEVPVGELTTGT